MKPSILIIQFRKRPEVIAHEQTSFIRDLSDSVKLEFVSALDDTIAWDYPDDILHGHQGVVLGGSGEFDFDGGRKEDDEARRIPYELLGKLRSLFEYIFEHDIPTLGICFGHQILGAFAGAQVVHDAEQKKTKSHEVHLMVDKNDYFLFSDLPDSFEAQYAHKDSLDRIPQGATLLINGGDTCKISALKYKKNIYTTQFHPELTIDDVIQRAKHLPEYLPEGVVIEELIKPSPHSSKILKKFGEMVIAHTQNELAPTA